MLTCPSDSLPQIVCPMDEDSVPPNLFCSAHSHSEPPPPFLPLSSVPPSCANDGIPGQRRSGRIHGDRAQSPKKTSGTDSGSIQKPFRQSPPPTKRQREDERMVQVFCPKQLRVKITNEDGFEFGSPTVHKNSQVDQESPQKMVSTENVVEQFAFNTTQNHKDAATSDMDGELDTLLGNPSASKGWVIGPLFQSFRSKMASFTEIVMSPVKLFKAHSPPPSMDNPEKLQFEQPADGLSDDGHSEPSNTIYPDGQTEMDTKGVEPEQQRLSDIKNAQNTKTDVNYSRKLFFNEESSTNDLEKTNEQMCEDINCLDSAPLQHNHIPHIAAETVSESVDPAFGPSVLLQTSGNCITAQSKLDDQKESQTAFHEPLPRKRMRNRSELKKVVSKTLTSKKKASDIKANDSIDNSITVPISSSDCRTQPDADCSQLTANVKGKKKENRLIRQSLRSNNSNGMTMNAATDLQQLAYTSADVGGTSIGLKPLRQSQNMLKEKEMIMMQTNTKNLELINEASDSELFMEPPREEAMLTSSVLQKEEILNPSIKRKTHSTRAKKKAKRGQEMSFTVNEEMLKTKTESSPEAMLVCSLDKSSDFLENDQNICGSKVKPSGLCKRQNTRPSPVISIVRVDDSMDLETTVAISSTKVEDGALSEVFVRPGIKQLQSKCKNANKKPLKRKSPVQTSSVALSDVTLYSTSMVLLESSELADEMAQREKSLQTGFTRSSKRPKKGNSFKSCETHGAQEKQLCIDEINRKTRIGQTKEGKSKNIRNAVYFEMTPFKNDGPPAPSCSSSHSNVPVLSNEAELVVHEKEKSPASPQDPSNIRVSELRSRKVSTRPKMADKQKRKCRVLHSNTCKGEELPTSFAMDDADLPKTPAHKSESSTSRSLLRSYSCPEIPSFRSLETPWTASQHSPHHSRTPASPQHQSSHTPHAPNPQKSVHRARRHTVCSVEVEREIAPLCLRKEVYPTRRSAPYDFVTQHLSPTLALSPSSTLSALASCFLSSPLAFLSKKAESRCSAASPGTSMHVSSPTSSSLKSPFSSPIWNLPVFLQSAGSSHATLDPCSSISSLECEPLIRQPREEEDGEDTSSSSQEFEDAGLTEEKALSDSEIKVAQKHEERGKVSSIRIRKTLPKPQNNLTPMGLPKPIRLKKKEFSLEEIYTNKNFSKPPESRLETIFEVPYNRRNGSESWFGQRRVKRFLQFLEVGEVRKPKKPLVGVGKTGGSSSRTRRGGSSKDEPSITAQDVDSLLCAKLDELNLWLINDQNS